MLSIDGPIGARGAAKYYFEDYYFDQQTPLCSLSGGGAKSLNHTGPLSKDEFSNLLHGFSPDGKKALVQNAGAENRQCALDCTFSPPKSFSVILAFAPDNERRALEGILRRAAAEGFQFLEEVAGRSRRGKGGAVMDKALLLSADFLHYTNRSNEPGFHIHKILFNLGFRPDGTTGALWTKEIFRNKMAAGKVFRDALTRMLQQEMGLEIEPRKVGFHIKGVPQDLCDVFSSRRKQILKEMEKAGVSGAVAAKIAALSTRPKKEHIPIRELRERWLSIGRDFGFGSQEAKLLLDAGQASLREAESQSVHQGAGRSLVAAQKQSGTDEVAELGNGRPRLSPSRARESTAEQNRQDKHDKGGPAEKQSSSAAPNKEAFGRAYPFFKKRLLFPYAPEWSPLKNLKTAYLSPFPERQ